MMKKFIGITVLIIGLFMASFGFWRFVQKVQPSEVEDGMRVRVVNVQEGDNHGLITMGFSGLILVAVGAGIVVIGSRVRQ